jgi:phosphoglycolate phosphatase
VATDAALFLDLDGTLCDSKPGIVRCIRHAMEGMGQPLDPGRDLDWCLGPPLNGSLARLLGTGDAGTVARAVELYRERYRTQGIYEAELYPGMLPVLQDLAADWRLCVVTSKPEPFAVELVRHFSLDGLIKGVHGSLLDGTRSAKIELVAHALAAEGLSAERVIMVGDREHDMEGALANGVKALGALWGYGSRVALQAAGALVTLERPQDLPPALRGMLPARA